VIVSGTSEPIAEADVAIVIPDGVLETTTDAAGRFALANVPAGRQTVVVRADGFFVESTARNTDFFARAEMQVTVSAGAAPSVVPTVSMVQSGTISGKVVDPSGNPMPFVRVQALRPEVGALNSGVIPDFGNRMTDDRGEYRMFFVPPGEYVVRAQVREVLVSPVPTRPGEAQRLVSTLFPSTTDVAQAGKVIVKSGEEIRGIDISVQMQVVTLQPPAPRPTGGVRISGVVIDGAQPWVGTAALLLGSEAEPGAPQVVVDGVIVGGTPGAFEITSVPPGNYDLFARMFAPNGSPSPDGSVQAWGRTTVEVRDQNLENVRITIRPSVDVPGVVKIDGKLATEVGTLKVGLSPTGIAGRISNYRGVLDRTQSPDANGKVTIPRAAEGNYQVFVQGADNFFIADVRQGDTSVLTSGITVGNATPAPFEVLLSSSGGSVEGIVSRSDKSPMGGATVLLVPVDKQLLSQYKTATAGPDGKYVFRGVRPGEYKVFGGPPGAVPPGGLTPEFLSSIESRGASVAVKAAAGVKVDVEANTN
jgi:hypothetical protein